MWLVFQGLYGSLKGLFLFVREGIVIKHIKDIKLMQMRSLEIKQQGRSIGFVPTMGYFHDGHIELMRYARSRCDVVIVSIFVNAIQFGPNEDFEKYPRDIERDLKFAKQAGVDIVFNPEHKDMYPDNFQTEVSVGKVTKYLCGASRPGHFNGVTTIVSKLFNIVRPDIAVFGEKDYQQLVTIKQMVMDLNMPVTVIGRPIVRETDGLAMSSRNIYLSNEERKAALGLKKTIELAKRMVSMNENDCKKIIHAVKNELLSKSCIKIDYVQLCDTKTLEPVEKIKQKTLLALAVFIGSTRLIDNCILDFGV